MDNDHSVNPDQQSVIAQRVARVAVGKLQRLGYSKREILELMQNAVAVYRSSVPAVGTIHGKSERKEEIYA